METRAGIVAEIAKIGERLRAHGPFGSVTVLGSDGELTVDHDGDAVVRLRLKLEDPVEGQTTWPLDDVDALQQEVEQLAAAADLPYVVTEFYPETADESADGSPADEELRSALDRDTEA